MRATTSLRQITSAQMQPAIPPQGQAHLEGVPALPPAHRPPAHRPQRGERLRRWLVAVLVLSLVWGALTGWRADALVFGIPAVLAGSLVQFLLPAAPRWRLSLRGALGFALWFAVQSVRGAVDVARRAFAPDMGLRPCFRAYPLTLPQGAARVMFVNTITLLPGTLSAEIEGDTLIVHMLDGRAPLEADLADLDARIRALFALPQNPELS
jgi:multicomponent Na+:H+ antiporter subunit E